jgi:hypothetical protein
MMIGAGKMLAVFLLAALFCLGATPPSAVIDGDTYHRLVPLGAENFELKPSGHMLYVIASAESPEFEGWAEQKTDDGRRLGIRDASGNSVQRFPNHVDFRVSATAIRGDMLNMEEPYSLTLNDDLNQFLLNLRFRLIDFDALKMTFIGPDSVQLIGMPAEVHYAERVYRVSFTFNSIPITDRLVLEVLTPEGERLCKFHLEFM